MNQAIEEFKEQLIPKVPDFFYEIGTQKYMFKQTLGDNQKEWVPLAELQASRILMTAGMRGAKTKAEDMSPVIKLLSDTTMSSERTVHYSGPMAGYRDGLIKTGGIRILVTSSPRIIKPAAGDWSTIRAIIEGLLGESDGVQLPYFYAWLKLSYEALRDSDTRGMPAVALCGPADCGKTFLQKYLITPVLGGRSAKPYMFMSGKTTFNADLFGAEHLAMGDENPATDLRSRRAFGAILKNFVAEEDQYLQAKHCTARTARPYWRLTISLNDEPENLLVLPPFDGSIEDKLSLFHARTFRWPMRVMEPNEKKIFAAQFASEIPAFLYWLSKYQIPDYTKARRWTVATYHNPRLLNCLTEVSPEFRLVELIKMCYLLPPDKEGKVLSGGKYDTIQMTALELERGLTADESPVRYEARQLLNGQGRKMSAYLSRLGMRFPKNFTRERTGKERQWKITGLHRVLAAISEGAGYE
jgi:hypothetical protein